MEPIHIFKVLHMLVESGFLPINLTYNDSKQKVVTEEFLSNTTIISYTYTCLKIPKFVSSPNLV